MQRSLPHVIVFCGAIGALALAPSRASAAVRPQQAMLAALRADSLDTVANAATPVVPAPLVAPPPPVSAARAMGLRRRAKLDSVVAVARAQLNTRYRWGGDTPKGFDCSGLVRYVMQALDFSLPRTAREQAMMGTPVPRDTAQLRAGDILLFGRKGKVTHIGIYVGNGNFVHASTTAKRVVERPLLRKPARGIVPWIGARRLLATSADSTPATATASALPNGG